MNYIKYFVYLHGVHDLHDLYTGVHISFSDGGGLAARNGGIETGILWTAPNSPQRIDLIWK